MVGSKLTWTDWRNHGDELSMLRALAPSVSEDVFAAAWRLLEASDEPEDRAAVLELLSGCEEADC